MTQNDVLRVLEIENQISLSPWSEGIFRDCIKVGYDCWVLELDNELVGYGLMTVKVGEGHIVNLAIDPDYQRQGLGRQLLTYLIEQAKAQDADLLLLEVRESNDPAILLYKDFEFTEIGRRDNYYDAPGGVKEHALVLGLSLV